MGKGKPHGHKAARKLAQIRKKSLWKMKSNKKKTQSSIHADPFKKCGFAKGIVVEKLLRYRRESGRCNNGFHQIVKVLLKQNGQKVLAKVPYDGGANFISENDEILISQVRKGKNIGDIDGGSGAVKYKVVKVCGHSLRSLYLNRGFPRRGSI